ncbi:hypothetical protein GQ600_25872 [Phytophthora cactorum]|nr:hypothetical protein GQ600_25872 [Phytophthora cactorum]
MNGGLQVLIKRRVDYTPLAGSTTDNAAARRKLRQMFLQVHLQLLSAFIMELGYYDDLSTFVDRVHDILMWFDGKEAKLYDRSISRALDSYQADEDGYGLIPELLAQSQTLDLPHSKDLRLIDNTLD